MRGKNRHLTEKERFYIEKALKKRIPVSRIADDLGYSRQTIYREIRRGTFEKLDDKTLKLVSVYAYDVGQRIHDQHMQNRPRNRKLDPDDDYILSIKKLILDPKYSPEAAFYAVPGRKVCIKTLYNWIHAGYIPGLSFRSLPYAKKRKKEKEKPVKRPFSRGTSIEDRPAYVNDRSEFGHWEMDTVYSSHDDRTCLLVLSERKGRKEKLIRIPDRTAGSVIRALDALERKIGSPAFRRIFKTITCDNGMEFSDWQSIERSCRTKGKRTKVYFCHPYCSGERGTNENQNKMVRRWIPKGDDIGLYSKQDIQQIEHWINTYPRPMFVGTSSDVICHEFFPESDIL